MVFKKLLETLGNQYEYGAVVAWGGVGRLVCRQRLNWVGWERL